MLKIAHQPPRFSAADVTQIARRHYNLTGTAHPLPSERDQNFRLVDESGTAYVLKIANAAEDPAILDLQNCTLAHLNAHSESLRLPQQQLSAEGAAMTAIEGEDGLQHLVRLFSYLPGKPLAKANPHTPDLLHQVGRLMGEVDRALINFSHPAAHRTLQWDIRHAAEVITRHLPCLADDERRTLVTHFLSQFERESVPRLAELRQSIIHNDGNDYNLIVAPQQIDAATNQVAPAIGLIDFGDMVYSYTVAEVAIAAAYAILDKPDSLAAAAQVISGYHTVYPLTEAELAVLFHLICLRLCTSVTLAAYQQQREPENDYLAISEQPAWAALETLIDLPPALAHYTFRHVCDLVPCPQTPPLENWLRDHPAQIGPVIEPDLKREPLTSLDLSVGSPLLGRLTDRADTDSLTRLLFGQIAADQTRVGLGHYNEARQVYTGSAFQTVGGGWRTIHLGVDLFLPPGAPVFAPLDGEVHSFHNNDTPLDYGPTIILTHTVDTINAGRIRFYTLYGHLSPDSLEGLRVGMPIKKGAQIGAIGAPPDNGNWPPHLHVQLITDLLGRQGEFPGVAAAEQRAVWLSLSPNPNLILGIPAQHLPPAPQSKPEILKTRREKLGPSLSISYRRQPLKIVRGAGQYLYDETGRAYLDGVNNVCHVGHCHPRVVAAGQAQMAVLNTNTRYLHENLARYVERLIATLPEPLSVCFFVCSGSEANELALRLAKTHTGQQDMLIVDGAYHGNTNALIDISPYKHNGPGGQGTPPHVHNTLMPDPYRGPYPHTDPAAGEKYAAHVQQAIQRAQAQGRGIAGYICESLLSCGGQIVLPPGYLRGAYRHVRAAGGVCIADEVQVGFGRVGTHFWGFETQGVVPDIVTMGKPMGNGHPLAAVVTTPQIAASFNNGMEYFNTFGGNPVSCAIGLAVLDVIQQERLQENALRVGDYLQDRLRGLATRYPLIGEVRGLGLFIGVELVLDRGSREPAPQHAAYIANRMKDAGILISTDGPLHNVLKLKPPLVFAQENADLLVTALDQILQEDVLQVLRF